MAYVCQVQICKFVPIFLLTTSSLGALLEAVNAPSADYDGYVLGLQRSNGAMAICRQIATAGKHVAVRHNRADIAGQIGHDPDAGTTFVRFTWNGKVVDDMAVYLEALKIWMHLYRGLGLKRAEELEPTAKLLGLE
jgi:hypothetical protein